MPLISRFTESKHARAYFTSLPRARGRDMGRDRTWTLSASVTNTLYRIRRSRASRWSVPRHPRPVVARGTGRGDVMAGVYVELRGFVVAVARAERSES
jgi:hypothetical protein